MRNERLESSAKIIKRLIILVSRLASWSSVTRRHIIDQVVF